MGSVAGIVGSILTGTGAIADLSNSATNVLRSGYGRGFELESDEYGAEFLALAGYNPLAMIDVIHVLKDHSLFAKNVLNQPQVYHGLFTSHPKNDKRLHEAVEKSLHLFPEELMEPERDFWEMVDGMTYGRRAHHRADQRQHLLQRRPARSAGLPGRLGCAQHADRDHRPGALRNRRAASPCSGRIRPATSRRRPSTSAKR